MSNSDEGNGSSKSEDDKEKGASEISAAKMLKLPPFWQINPQLWFVQVEAQFHTYAVKSDNTKYYMLISALDTTVLQQVSDVLMSPPATEKYERLKKELVARFTDSEEKQLRKVLTDLELGDKKPSQLLRELRMHAGGKLNENVLRTVWLQRLPSTVQQILSASDSVPLEKMAAIADKIREVNDNGNIGVAAIATPAGPQASTSQSARASSQVHIAINTLEKRVEDLTRMIEQINRDGTHRRERSQSRRRPRSKSTQPGVCFYHRRFRDRANKCTKPCSYVCNPENENNRR